VNFRKIGFVLLGIALLVGATLVILAATTGKVGCLGPCQAGDPYLVIISGTLSPTSSDNWNLTVWAKDTALNPVTAISVVSSPNLPQATSLTFDYKGAIVSTSNPIPVGQVAYGSLSVDNLTAGASYEMTISIVVQNGGQQVQTLSLEAQ
jgi:hypothetical protein